MMYLRSQEWIMKQIWMQIETHQMRLTGLQKIKMQIKKIKMMIQMIVNQMIILE